jgi:hypothetical protein
MPARTRRRAKFDFQGRPFVWWVDADRYLRICSLDKKFIISLSLWGAAPEVVEVIGQEFPGLDRSERRPVWLIAPPASGTSMGSRVNELLTWSFARDRPLTRADPQRTSGGRDSPGRSG